MSGGYRTASGAYRATIASTLPAFAAASQASSTDLAPPDSVCADAIPGTSSRIPSTDNRRGIADLLSRIRVMERAGVYLRAPRNGTHETPLRSNSGHEEDAVADARRLVAARAL